MGINVLVIRYQIPKCWFLDTGTYNFEKKTSSTCAANNVIILTDRQRWTDRQTDKQAGRQRDTERQRDIQTDRQREREVQTKSGI